MYKYSKNYDYDYDYDEIFDELYNSEPSNASIHPTLEDITEVDALDEDWDWGALDEEDLLEKNKTNETNTKEGDTSMNRKYAKKFWAKLLEKIKYTDKRRMLTHPRKDKDNEIMDPINIMQESALWDDDRDKSSAYVIFLRAFQNLELTEGEEYMIVDMLANATCRVEQFRIIDTEKERRQ